MALVNYYKSKGYEICYHEPASKDVMLEFIDKDGLLQQKFVTFLDVESAHKFDKEWRT